MPKYNLYLRICTAVIYVALGIYFFIDKEGLAALKPWQRQSFGTAFILFGLFRAGQVYFQFRKNRR